MIVFVTAVCWFITMICLFFLRKKHPEINAPFRTPLYPVTLIVAFIALVFMISRLSNQAELIGTCWILFGVVVYLLFHKTGLKKYCRKKEE